MTQHEALTRRDMAGPGAAGLSEDFSAREGTLLVLLCVTVVAVLAWQWIGLLGSDDLSYSSGADQWMKHFPAVGDDHWQLRYTVVLPLALFFLVLGKTAFALVLPSVIAFALMMVALYCFVRRRFGYPSALVTVALVLMLPITPTLATALWEDMTETFWVVLSLILFVKSIENPRSLTLIASGLCAGCGFLTRETTAGVLLFYGVCFLFRPMMPRRGYFIMAFGFIIVAGGQIAYLWAKTGDPLYRERLSLHHDQVSRVEQIVVTRQRGFAFDPSGNLTINPWIDPFLALFASTKYGLLCYLAVIAGWRWTRTPPLSQAQRRTVIIFLGAAVAWFAFVAVNAEILFIGPRYFYVTAVMCCVPAAVGLVRVWQGGARWVPALATLAVVGVGLGFMALQDTDPLFAKWALVRYVQSTPEQLYADNRMIGPVNFELSAIGSPRQVLDTTPPPPGSLAAVEVVSGFARKYTHPVIDPEHANVEEVARFVPQKRIVGRIVDAIGLGAKLPPDIRFKLDGQSTALVIYRVH